MSMISTEEHISLFFDFFHKNESVRLFTKSLNQIYRSQGCLLDAQMRPRTPNAWVQHLNQEAFEEIINTVKRTDTDRPLYGHDFHGIFNYLIYVLPSRKGNIGYLLVKYDQQSLINKIFDLDRLIKPVYDEILNYFDCMHPYLEPLSLGHDLELNAFNYKIFNTTFMDFLKNNTIEKAMYQIFEWVGKWIGLDRITLMLVGKGQGRLYAPFDWVSSSKYAAGDNLSDIWLDENNFGYRFEDHDGIFFQDDMTGVGLPERLKYFEKTRSLLINKLIYQQEFAGYIVFSTIGEVHHWTENDIELIKVLNQVISTIALTKLGYDDIDKAYRNLRQIFSNINTSVYIIDPLSYEIIYMNHSLRSRYPQIKEGDRCHQALYGSSVPCKGCPFATFGKWHDQIYFENHNEEDDTYYDISASRMEWSDGRQVYLLNSIDITEKRKQTQMLEQTVFVDQQLGIQNRAGFLKKIEQVEKGSLEGAVLKVDIDDFKHFNDTFGQNSGDMLLSNITRAISSMKQKNDEEIIYRTGWDEFHIILENYTREEACSFADKVLHIPQGFQISTNYPVCTLSIGLTTFPNASQDIGSLMDQLDFSVEEAKFQGKNRLVVYDDDIAKKNMRKLKIVAILQDAIKNDLFEVYYQPIYNIRESCFDRAEALLRLNNTVLGNIPPSEFIPIAEEHGLIVEIGYIVIDKVAQKIAEIRRLNPDFKTININVSVLQLFQKNFAERFIEILKSCQVDPGMIELEITETGMIRSFDEMRDIMKNLKSFGIAFSLDDFGTGYSNLRYLIDLPFNCIKLDRHFINEINTDMRSRTFLKSLISLTKTLNYGVVAEGVEEPEQYQILSESNCDYIQGFYMARPMPGNEFNRFLYLR